MKKIEEEKKKRLQHNAGWTIDHNTTIRIISSKPPLLPFLLNTNNSRSIYCIYVIILYEY